MADRERVIQWLESEFVELLEQNENLRTFLAELKEECESIRKNWIQVRKGSKSPKYSAIYLTISLFFQHSKQVSNESMDELKVFPGRASISLLEHGFSFDFEVCIFYLLKLSTTHRQFSMPFRWQRKLPDRLYLPIS